MDDYDKVTHHAAKLQQYLNNLQLTPTRSKTSAILGPPLDETVPVNDVAREMDTVAGSDDNEDEDMDVSVGQVQRSPLASTCYTLMATTPSTCNPLAYSPRHAYECLYI